MIFERNRYAYPDSRLTEKNWLLNKEHSAHGLFYLGKNKPSTPIVLSAPMPNGAYYVSVLLEATERIDSFSKSRGFRYRFGPDHEFSAEEALRAVIPGNSKRKKDSTITWIWAIV